MTSAAASIAADINETVRLWKGLGITAPQMWLELTLVPREAVGWHQVRDFMVGWESARREGPPRIVNLAA